MSGGGSGVAGSGQFGPYVSSIVEAMVEGTSDSRVVVESFDGMTPFFSRLSTELELNHEACVSMLCLGDASL